MAIINSATPARFDVKTGDTILSDGKRLSDLSCTDIRDKYCSKKEFVYYYQDGVLYRKFQPTLIGCLHESLDLLYSLVFYVIKKIIS